jgi:ParB-like chromosome segregation protein Spo0J
MRIEMKPIDSVRPYGQNPRVNDAAVAAVAKSLQEFGWRQPIVVDKDDVIVVGHTRWKAARKVGMTEVPVHVATGLTDAQLRAYRIADNQTATIAEWDETLLPLELEGLKEMEFDLGLLGFDPVELDRLLTGDGKDGLTDPDEVPSVPENPVTSRRPLAARRAPVALRRLNAGRRRPAVARRGDAVPDGDRPALRRGVRPRVAPPRRTQRLEARREGHER